MKSQIWNAILTLLLLAAVSNAQAPPTTVPTNRRPSLRRDRTQRVLYPKIIQCEDERTVTSDLVEMVTQSHGGAKRRAILALGRIGYPSGLTALIDLLNSGGKADDHNAEFRALAAFSLGEIEHHYAAASLLDHLNPDIERSVLVRARSAEALGKIASNKLSIASLGEYGVTGIATTIASRLPSISQQPSNDEKLLACLALTALLRLKQPGTVPMIAAQLGSPDADIRWQAANALARIRENIGVAVPQLLTLLEDKSELVRASAARALGISKDKKAVEPLIKLLSDKDERVVENAIGALGSISDPRAVDPLVTLGNRLLEDYKAVDRDRQGVPAQQNILLLISTALGQMKDQKGLAFLKSFRSATAAYSAQPEIEMAVAKFGDQAFFDTPDDVSALTGNWKTVSARAHGLGELGSDRARASLLKLFAAASSSTQYLFCVPDILTAMAAAKADGLKQTLVEQLKARDVIIRATAATLLGDLGDESSEVVDALDSAYKTAKSDQVNEARIAVLDALEKLKHPLSVQVLADSTRDSDYVVRLRASEFLRQSKHEVTTKLQIGKAETGHDRAYWQRMARFSETASSPIAVIHTRKGDIRIELYPEDAPMTVDNFIQLSKRGFYNGLSFMRVVPNFVIQGGDPRGDGNGGPGYQIRCEVNLKQYGVGAVGMALAGKDTGGSQFFITHSPQPHLDGGYTIFGQVVEGMDIVNRIARDDRIDRIEIIEPPNPAGMKAP